MKKRTPGILLLEDGRAFKGRLFGFEGKGFGEVVFNTALTGYQEIITDPSYAGQIVTMTATQIGNYGINLEDDEAVKPWLSGFVCRELSGVVSNFRSERTLSDFLKAFEIPAIDGIDTRALTLHLREHGAQRGVIAAADQADKLFNAMSSGETTGDWWNHSRLHEINKSNQLLKEVLSSPKMEGQDLVKVVSTDDAYDMTEAYVSKFAEELVLKPGTKKPKCAAIDYGAKKNILRCLVQAGFEVRVFPATSTAAEIMEWQPEAVFLSNGPGDPAILDYAIETARGLIQQKLPIFGICLGHQILTHAFGGKTFKLKFGHHAANHPVKELATGLVEITSQNHGFATDPDSLPDDVEVTHINQNDNTVSGIKHKELPVFSVQYHPEASPGPHDSLHLFRRFYRSVVGS